MAVAVSLPVPASPSLPRISRVRAGAILVVTALLLLVVDGSAPHLLGRATSARPDPLVLRGDAYRAQFDAAGFTFLPDAATGSFVVALASVTRGGRAVALSPSTWSA